MDKPRLVPEPEIVPSFTLLSIPEGVIVADPHAVDKYNLTFDPFVKVEVIELMAILDTNLDNAIETAVLPETDSADAVMPYIVYTPGNSFSSREGQVEVAPL